MRVLLTGASGFLGQYVARSLQANNIETVAIGRSQPGNYSPAKFQHLDLLHHGSLESLLEKIAPTHLLHFAWYAEPGAYWTSPLNLRWVEATVRLVEAFCHVGGQKVVVAGTCAEYDWNYGYCAEDITPINPTSMYGICKDATRRLVTALCVAQNVPCSWGRIFFPYGPGEDNRRLISSIIAVFQGKQPPFAINALAYRDYLHAYDLAEAFVKLLQTNIEGIYNICSGDAVRLADIVRLLADAQKADPRVILALSEDRKTDPPLLIGDNRKLLSLGWRPQYSIADIFKSMSKPKLISSSIS